MDRPACIGFIGKPPEIIDKELKTKISKLYVGSSQKIGIIVADRILDLVAKAGYKKE